jgi:hypothetical protein
MLPLLKKGGLLQALFDFSFNHFFTPKIIKLLYGLSIFFAGLIAILFIIFGFRTSTGFGIFALLVGAPLIFLLAAIYSRICPELMIAVFRIATVQGIGRGSLHFSPLQAYDRRLSVNHSQIHRRCVVRWFWLCGCLQNG